MIELHLILDPQTGGLQINGNAFQNPILAQGLLLMASHAIMDKLRQDNNKIQPATLVPPADLFKK